MALITEDHLEQQCLEWFQELGVIHVFKPQLIAKQARSKSPGGILDDGAF
jgi:hypothetical protein